MIEHTAKCHCGSVTAHCRGDPDPVVICHCHLCRRRTGSLFQIAAWYDAASVSLSGDTIPFTRTTGDAGLPFTFNFCPRCGTTLWWLPANPGGPLAGKIAIAGGCFEEPGFLKPTISIYEEHKEAWLVLPPDVASFGKGL